MADDVKYSIERNAMPASGSWNASQPLASVVGGQAVLDGTADTAEGISVMDDYTVQFQLVNPDAYFVHALSLVTNFIVPRESVEEWGEDYGFHPDGTGPFMMTEWTPGQQIVFERNPNYFVEGLPYLDGIVYELGAEPEVSLLRYERGEVDVIADGVPSGEIARVATDPALADQFLNTKTYLTVFLGFNTETPPFDNPDVRRALAMAIDRDRLIQLASNTGSLTYDWYPTSHYNCSANRDPAYPYDPDAARQLLADAGFPDGFEVSGWFRVVRPWLTRIPEAIQQDLAAIGVQVELLQLESAVATEMLNNGELPVFVQAWGASFPDPFNFATELFATSSTYGKRWRYSNPEVDALVVQAKQDTNPDSRCATWLQIEALVLADTPAAPLFVAGYPDLRSPRIEDFAYHDTYHRPRGARTTPQEFAPMTSDTRPNALIFVMDTQPVRNLTPYGYDRPTTPNLERLAREGLVYDHHFVTGCWTVPAHASLFTGKYQSGHGTGVQHEFLEPAFPTMAEILNGQGYQTVAFSNNTWVNQDETNIGRGFGKFVLVERPGGQNPQIGPEDDFLLEDELDLGSAQTVELVQQWFKDEYDTARPYFMFINCVEPHLRVWAPQPFRRQFLLPGISEAEARAVNQDEFSERLGRVPGRPAGHMTSDDWAILKSLYDGETACLDHRIGLLVEHLRTLGLLDQTLLVMISDHGDLLDRPGMMGHHLSLFDDLIHTPLIVRWPGVVPAGQRFDGFVQICDWLPTLLEVLGVPRGEAVWAHMQGTSLVPTWSGQEVRPYVVAEYMKPLQTIERALRRDPDFDFRRWLRRWKAIRTRDYKYHWASDGQDLLFDVRADPGERRNLAATLPEQVSQMRQMLEDFLLALEHHDFGDAMRDHGFRNVRWDNVDRLRAWGVYRDITPAERKRT